MNNLEKWYQESGSEAEARGVIFSIPAERPIEYIDGEYSEYMFRFIDRGNIVTDIEIMNTMTGKAIECNLNPPFEIDHSIYDYVIEFIYNLKE